MSEQPDRPRALDFPLRQARRLAASLRNRLADLAQPADRDWPGHGDRYQEIRRHVAAGLFVLLLAGIGASLLLAL
jgi:hypothetical protein